MCGRLVRPLHDTPPIDSGRCFTALLGPCSAWALPTHRGLAGPSTGACCADGRPVGWTYRGGAPLTCPPPALTHKVTYSCGHTFEAAYLIQSPARRAAHRQTHAQTPC
jgi:hypothetical protein